MRSPNNFSYQENNRRDPWTKSVNILDNCIRKLQGHRGHTFQGPYCIALVGAAMVPVGNVAVVALPWGGNNIVGVARPVTLVRMMSMSRSAVAVVVAARPVTLAGMSLSSDVVDMLAAVVIVVALKEVVETRPVTLAGMSMSRAVVNMLAAVVIVVAPVVVLVVEMHNDYLNYAAP